MGRSALVIAITSTQLETNSVHVSSAFKPSAFWIVTKYFRALYIVNWYYRYTQEGFSDKIAIVAGCVQTVLYLDFFYLYITKGNYSPKVHRKFTGNEPDVTRICKTKIIFKLCTARSLPFQVDPKEFKDFLHKIFRIYYILFYTAFQPITSQNITLNLI